MLGNVFSKPRITSLSSFVSVGDDAQPESVTVPDACVAAGAAVFPWVALAPIPASTTRPVQTATASRRYRFMCPSW